MTARAPGDSPIPCRDSVAGLTSCICKLADTAGDWATTSSSARDPWDEVVRQQEIHDAALAVAEAARRALISLAERSQAHRRLVSCDQDDWRATIADSFTDLIGDTFGCLPRAISGAKRELSLQYEPSRPDTR